MGIRHGCIATAILAILVGSACSQAGGAPAAVSITPGRLPRIGTVSERFQSFNIEMIEVTGGRFWKPYKELDAILKGQAAARKAGATPAGMDPGLYQQRSPIDLNQPRLRKLAAALGPAYMRVSGTWANTTWFQDSDAPAPSTPPKGFGGVLTRAQWKSVVDFAKAVDAGIVTSFATSTGTRDARGVWTPIQAQKLLDYTAAVGGSIAAAEFMNEPTIAAMGGAPPGYDAAAYGRDLAVFRPFAKRAAPGMLLLGPGSVAEGPMFGDAPPAGNMQILKSEDLLAAAGPVFDAFSYHFYGAVSKRCAALGASAQTTPAAALSAEWLSRSGRVEEFYKKLRDRFEPGKPLWITETADAACGGNPWAPTFLDSFRYLDQLGTLAKRGVQVVAHNTLAASDYGLLDENSLAPRPNYWSALMWRKFMGTTVLDAGSASADGLHLYAHCLRGIPGGVAILAINTNRAAAQSLELPVPADRYTLTARTLEAASVQLNGNDIKLGAGDSLPRITGVPAPSGRLSLDPASITFLAIPAAKNASCR
jgi:heparanase 1